jgi:hypothetical protein
VRVTLMFIDNMGWSMCIHMYLYQSLSVRAAVWWCRSSIRWGIQHWYWLPQHTTAGRYRTGESQLDLVVVSDDDDMCSAWAGTVLALSFRLLPSCTSSVNHRHSLGKHKPPLPPRC